MSSRRTRPGATASERDIGEAARAVRLRPGPVRGDGRRALRAASRLRQRRRSGGGRRARALRGRRPLRARRPLAALGAHGGDLRAREPQARLLPVDGVPHRPLAGQQRHEPPARSRRAAASSTEQGPRLARAARAGARRRPGQRRPRPPGGLLPRLDGHDAAAGDGLRPALRVRHLQADHPGRLAARAAGQLAAPPGPVGGRAPAREGGGQAELLVRGARRKLARRRRAGRPA